MAGVRDTNVIDVVAHDPTSDEYVLVLVEDRPWGADADQASQLREKINTYVGFVLDGSLARTYPETAGQRVRLQLDCPEQPAGEFATIVDHADVKLAELGMRLHLNVRG